MKFLVTTTPRRLQMPTAPLVEAARGWLHARLADKTFDCCHGFTTGGGVVVVNAESGDRVAQLLMEYPAFMAMDWKVEPLCDINKSFDNIMASIKRAGG